MLNTSYCLVVRRPVSRKFLVQEINESYTQINCSGVVFYSPARWLITWGEAFFSMGDDLAQPSSLWVPRVSRSLALTDLRWSRVWPRLHIDRVIAVTFIFRNREFIV